MAVRIRTMGGASLIRHDVFLNDVYMPIGFVVRPEMFDVNTPFLMDSNAIKFARALETSSAVKIASPKKKRKWKKYLPSKMELLLEERTKEIVARGMEEGYFSESPPTSDQLADNNSKARRYSSKTEELDILISLSKHLKSQQMKSTDLIICDKNLSEIGQLQNHLPCFVHCNSTKPVVVNLMGELFVLPPDSSFLLGDITEIESIVNRGKKFDLILLDPPWKNKSVKRKKGYEMLNDSDLLAIPVQRLASPDCIVAVWSTNNPRQMAFIKDVLFPHWSVLHCADLHWVKVTRKGEFVCEPNSVHKKPYENLVLGICASDVTKERCIENDQIFVSVPSAIHSHKPPICEILKPYLCDNPACLEIFARYLLPGWTSCGNEVLKFQHISHFKQESVK